MVGNLFCHADSEPRYVRLSPILSLVSFRFQYCLLWFPLIITCSVILPETNFFANTEEKSKIRPMIPWNILILKVLSNYRSIINSKYYFHQSIMEKTKVNMKLPTQERTYTSLIFLPSWTFVQSIIQGFWNVLFWKHPVLKQNIWEVSCKSL